MIRGDRITVKQLICPCLVLIGAVPAMAIDIDLVYIQDQACCGNDDRVQDLQDLFAAAAAHWEDIIEDNYTLEVRFSFSNVNDPGVYESEINQQNPARYNWVWIKIPADEDAWYFDSTPEDDVEFDMSPKLYRNVHPAEQAEAFSGNPPGVFEVAYIGKENVNYAADLYSVILHEIGHSLGLSNALMEAQQNPACDEQSDPYFHLDPNDLGGAVMALKAYEKQNGDFDCGHLALGGIQECNDDVPCETHQSLMYWQSYPSHRSLPDAAAILAIAEGGNWQQIDLPRKYSLSGGGSWGIDSMWLGDRKPDGNDDVYIINDGITLVFLSNVNGFARNLTINNGSLMELAGAHKLDIGDTVYVQDDGIVRVNWFNSELEADQIIVENGGSLEAVLGLVDVNKLDIDPSGVVSGSATIDVADELENVGTIRGENGTLSFTTNNQNGVYDLDGFFDDDGATLDASGGSISFAGGWADNGFSGTAIVGSGNVLSYTDELRYEGTIYIGGANDARIDGPSQLSFGSQVFVDQNGEFSDELTITNQADVIIPDDDDTLTFAGTTTYVGGSYTGDGVLNQVGTAWVEFDTTIDVRIFDFDGDDGGNAVTNILESRTLTINSTKIEPGQIFDGYDGTVNILGGRLQMNTDLDFALEGVANMVSDEDYLASIGGNRIDLTGFLGVQVEGQLDAPIDIFDTGQLLTWDDGTKVVMQSVDDNHIYGGSITGPGLLEIAYTSLEGYGLIQPDVAVIGGVLVASGGELTIEGDITDLGYIGTNGPDAVLNVTHFWTTLAGWLELREGRVEGGNITNTATTSGVGTFGIANFSNSALLSPGPTFEAPGDLTGKMFFDASFAQVGSGSLQIGVGGTTPGDEHDQLVIRGTARLGGELDVRTLAGYNPACGDEIVFMTYTAVAGDFASFVGLELGNGLKYEPVKGPTEYKLVLVDDPNINGDACGPVEIVDAQSLRLHDPGGINETELAIDLDDTNGIEPRIGGVWRLEFTTSVPMDAETVSPALVAIACANNASPQVDTATLVAPDVIRINLDEALADQDCCSFSFAGMQSIFGTPLDDTFNVRPLEGDVNFSGGVTGGDAALIKPHFGESLAGNDLSAPWWDVNASGGVTGGDYAIIKPRFGNATPLCP